LEACLVKAKELGYGTSEEYTIRETYSGLTLDRPKLSELRQWVRDKKVDAVIAYTLDQLSRDPVHFIILQEELEKANVELILITEDIDSSDMGKLISHIKGFAAKLEAEKIKERTMRGKRARAISGKLPGGKSTKLYGYNYVAGKGVGEGIRYVKEEEANQVKAIYQWYVQERLPLKAITYRLMSLGVTPPSGQGNWGNATLHHILTNQTYLGKTYAFTQIHIKPDSHNKTIIKQKATHKILKPVEEWVEIPNATPAIITVDLFNQAQTQLQRNKELAYRNAKREYLLSGYLFCKYCGRRYTGGTRNHRTKEGIKYRRYYRCTLNLNTTAPRPYHNRTWTAEHLEAIVWKQIEDLLSKPDLVLAGLRAKENDVKQADYYTAELDGVEVKLRHTEKEKDRAWKAFELTGDERKFAEEIEEIMSKIEELEKQRAELQRRIELSKRAEINISSIQNACELVNKNLVELSFQNKKLALEALCTQVWLDAENITIEGTIPIKEGSVEFNPS